ncbi:ER degradation-enhancing alpha-mannosidase-like protein 2 isoform X2 [Oratosquilla oratoria]
MFYHAYDSYIEYAYPYDELRPLSCDGHDTWGSYSLTLVDALDTLAVMGNSSEFKRVYDIIMEKATFDSNINVSVFETNIRIVGGLLSAHFMSRRMGVTLEPGWPCSGPLLRLAEDVVQRLLPAFDTSTGMPYGTVNLKYGVPEGETPITCTAGVGTYIVEFGSLSRLTGNPLYEEVALRALYSLWNHRSHLDLFGNHIDVLTGRWTAQDAGIGAGVDSYFEYLVKGSVLLQRPELMAMFQTAREAIDKHLLQDDWYVWVTMHKGLISMPVFQSLEAYWPGVLTLVGDTEAALKTLHNYYQVWKQFGFTPEFYNIPKGEAANNRQGYPLRPELIESLMYVYRATQDPSLLEMGVSILRSIQHSAKTPCGYATVKNVNDHTLEDRMESFFLAETTKYLYLLFDPHHWLHNTGAYGTLHTVDKQECVLEAGGYIFNTEAHPIDPSALSCCTAHKDLVPLSTEDRVSILLDPSAHWPRHKGKPVSTSVKDNDKNNKSSGEEEPVQSGKLSVETGETEDTLTSSGDSGEVEISDSEDEKSDNKDCEDSNRILDNVSDTTTVTVSVSEETLAEITQTNVVDQKSTSEPIHSEKVPVSVNEPSGGMVTDKEPTMMTNKDVIMMTSKEVTLAEKNKVESDSIISPKEELVEKVAKESQGTVGLHGNSVDEGTTTLKKEAGPRFSSLSEVAERGEGNMSGMENSALHASVSSSKYVHTSPDTLSPVPSTGYADTITLPPLRKVFALDAMKERLQIDLASYVNLTLNSSFDDLLCPHPPFTYMLNIKGQMFNP